MLGTAKQMNDQIEEEWAQANAAENTFYRALNDLKEYGSATFASKDKKEVTIDLMDSLEEMQDEELWLLLATFWRIKSKGTQAAALTAASFLFEKLDRTINDSLETFL